MLGPNWFFTLHDVLVVALVFFCNSCPAIKENLITNQHVCWCSSHQVIPLGVANCFSMWWCGFGPGCFFTQPWEIHFIIQQVFLSTWLIFATHCCCTTFKIKKKNKHQPVCQAMCPWHWPPVAFGVLCHCRSALQFNHRLIVFCWLHSKAVFLLLVTVAYFPHLSPWATMGFLLVCFCFTAS